MKISLYPIAALIALVICACSSNDKNNQPAKDDFKLLEITINNEKNKISYTDIDPTTSIKLAFSEAVDPATVQANISLINNTNKQAVALTFNYIDNNTGIVIKPQTILTSYTTYEFTIQTNLKSQSGERLFTGKSYMLSTTMDFSDKFQRISDDDLLTLVQKQTFKYFWDFGHPTSGMARERTTSGNTVTTGGTGFGVMAILVAAERGFITRNEALQRTQKIVTFLTTKCTRYHGAFAHWVNGETGATIAFSQYDDGADLIETSLLMQGLLAARQYFKQNTSAENVLRQDITTLWEQVEWNWFQKNGEDVLYWHWSPSSNWQMNLKIKGWNEGLITYVLAAASPTHTIPTSVYHNGWASNGTFANGNSYFGIKLPLGVAYGGPLFFAHYSFLGINPQGLTDQYANYWEQNKNHSLIHYQYSITNPKGYAGYGADCWGLTASDGDQGYSAHSPNNDRGVIAPTAALSSMPYTPEESMKALHFYYYKLGDKIWLEHGFADAFNITKQWFDNQHIAIDQGTIIVMIENYRSGLLWRLFMADPEIKSGLRKLGFESPNI